jgi:hypothetical protein
MSDYSKLTKKQLLEIINTAQATETEKLSCGVCQELEKQVNDLKQEIKDMKDKQQQLLLKDKNRFCY